MRRATTSAHRIAGGEIEDATMKTTYTTTKIYDGTYMASSRAAAATGVHGFGKTRSKAIADLRRQIRNPV